jgi:hypothetical protein
VGGRGRGPDEGWWRFAARQVFLGDLGLPGDDLLPARGWLRWAALAFYGAVALVALAVVAFLVVR